MDSSGVRVEPLPSKDYGLEKHSHGMGLFPPHPIKAIEVNSADLPPLLHLLSSMRWAALDKHVCPFYWDPCKSLQMLVGPPFAHSDVSILPSLMICLAATAEERWMGSMKMLSVSVSETTEYLREKDIPGR